jgi:hypothetical protein
MISILGAGGTGVASGKPLRNGNLRGGWPGKALVKRLKDIPPEGGGVVIGIIYLEFGNGGSV